MLHSSSRYLEESRVYFRQAHDELAKGDLSQASEKGWGAAAEIVKAFAEENGQEHHGHRQIQSTVNGLVEQTDDPELGSLFEYALNWEVVEQTDDPELGSLFEYAAGLHRNFYEDWMSTQRVQWGIAAVERFISKVEPLLS